MLERLCIFDDLTLNTNRPQKCFWAPSLTSEGGSERHDSNNLAVGDQSSRIKIKIGQSLRLYMSPRKLHSESQMHGAIVRGSDEEYLVTGRKADLASDTRYKYIRLQLAQHAESKTQ